MTQGGATTTFGYWADGTRRRSSTVTPGKAATTTEFHYGPDGTLANDTTTSGAGASASASYLVTAGREARTLLPGTTPAGAVKTAATAAPVTSGAGVGYFLRDRHSSVTALVDSTGAVTDTYAYGDYGAPALLSGRPGSVVGTTPGTTPGTVNPLQYSGASLKAMYTDAALGTMMTPARFYDPSQGGRTARDAANLHNRYVGFDANPIMKADPTGQSAVGDFFLDALYVIVFAVAVYVTGGAAAAAAPAIFGAEAATAATAAAVTTFTAQAVATTANLVGLAANATRFADDVDNATSGAHFLTDSVRSDLNSVATVAGSVAGVAGMFAAGAETATAAAEDATGAAAKAAPDVEPVDESGYEADDESGYEADDESDEEAGDQKLSTSSRPRSSSAPDRLNRSSLASDDGAQQLGDRKIGSVLRDSPGQDATVKDAVSSQQLNDGLPDGYRRAPTGKTRCCAGPGTTSPGSPPGCGRRRRPGTTNRPGWTLRSSRSTCAVIGSRPTTPWLRTTSSPSTSATVSADDQLALDSTWRIHEDVRPFPLALAGRGRPVARLGRSAGSHRPGRAPARRSRLRQAGSPGGP